MPREYPEPFTFFRGELKLLQPKSHKVSVDLVLFLSFIKGIRKNFKVADLGAGFGFLSISLAKKYPLVEIFAVERDPLMVNIFRKNLSENRIGNVKVFEADIKEIREVFQRGIFNVVLANPPFFPKAYRGKNPYHFEQDTDLKDFIEASSYLLKDGGSFYLMIPSFRLKEALLKCEEVNLPPREMRIVYPKLSKEAKIVFIRCRKNLKGPIKVEKPLIINEEDGSYTDEVKNILESYL